MKSIPSSPAWSISGKYPLTLSSDTPGPGSYQPTRSHYEASPSYKLGSSTRSDFAKKNKDSPGPGAYDPNKYDQTKASRYSLARFGTSSRSPDRDRSGSPGPGAYNIPDKLQEGPMYSIKGKHSYRRDAEAPVRCM